ncbi:hypothetical protein K2X92_04065 [Candidatus Gracilibacteria bacterium]|nr:hypothetical protein [Candidatus Gracilibacteria bacterium]
MNKYVQSSLAAVALSTSVGCSDHAKDSNHSDGYAHVASISCDSPENPTATIKMRTLDKMDGICSYSRVEIVPGDIYFNTANHCLKLSENGSFRTDGVLAKSLTKRAKQINNNIDSVNALGKLPRPIPASRYTNEQMDDQIVTIFARNPNATHDATSCYKITGSYIAKDGIGAVVLTARDFQLINEVTRKSNTFGGSSGSAVLDHHGNMFGRLIASTDKNFGFLGTVLLINPIRKSDGSIELHQ